MNVEQINPYFQTLDTDYLYHLGIDTKMDLVAMFSDVEYVVLTRLEVDAEILSKVFAQQWYDIKEDGFCFTPIFKTERFHLYKIGPALIASHGVGMPSMLIFLNEIAKLLFYANKSDVTFFKVGPAGGIGGTSEGDMVIVESALNSKLEPVLYSIECGEEFTYPTQLDADIFNEIIEFCAKNQQFKLIKGNSIGAADFYEEQARLDGFLPLETTVADQHDFFAKAESIGVKALNMEASAFYGFCKRIGIKACAIDVIVVNRIVSDVILISASQQRAVLRHAFNLVTAYILNKLKPMVRIGE